jgi:hypothetical protein
MLKIATGINACRKSTHRFSVTFHNRKLDSLSFLLHLTSSLLMLLSVFNVQAMLFKPDLSLLEQKPLQPKS